MTVMGKMNKKTKSFSSETVELVTSGGGDVTIDDDNLGETNKKTKKLKKESGEKLDLGKNAVKSRLKDDLSYVTDLMSFIHIPQHRRQGEEEEEEEGGGGELTEEIKERLHLKIKPENRATSKEELKERLKKKMEEMRGPGAPNEKRQAKKLKRKMAKLSKEKENKELKQKLMEIGINAGKMKQDIAKDVEAMGAKMTAPNTKPGVKTSKGVVFSKFDFQEMEKEKKNLDPEAALRKIQKRKENIQMWEEKGRAEKVRNIENNMAWESALSKAQGEKVKDDEALLKKTLKKKKQMKGSKKRKWDERVETTEEKMAASQKKRAENISKRKKEKRDKKTKHAVAKGRHLPGF